MTRWIETDSLSNQNISSALEIGSYTADADRSIIVQFFADQVAGGGDYTFYATLQINGAGSAYKLEPATVATVAAGVTAIGGQSGIINVRNGDILKVYLDGLAGDTATPDTTVRFFELAALRPTTADRTLDVSSGGEAGVDWANVGSPTTTVGLSGTTVKTATDIETDTADIQGRIPAALVSGRIDASVGAMASNVVTAAAIATDAIDADALKTDAITEIQNGLATAAALTVVDDFLDTEVAAILADTNELQTDLVNGGRLDLLIDGIKAKTDNLPTDPADDSDIDAQLATIAGYLDTEVAAILADTNELQTDLVNGGRLDLLIDGIKAKTDLIPTDPAETSDIPSAATISDAVFDELLSGHAIPGSAGAALAAATAPTAAAVADAAWDELLVGHAIAGSAGAALSAAGGSADPLLNTVPGSYASGTAGAALGRIGSGQIATTSVVAQSGAVTTWMGDDYDADESRAIDWTDSDNEWPTLTGATIKIVIDEIKEYTGSVITATGTGKKVRLELTATQTALIAEGGHVFQVVATLQTTSRKVTLVEGTWVSKRKFVE